ncbi:MAG TPA: Ig-like domain repeat protein [Aquihabitans sp.]|nr:Ig-like domain repeat protein [Aquihabitans sp.]
MDDVVDGGPGDDFLVGSAGNDTLTDLVGANTFYAGTGNDTLTTGPGSDEVRGDAGDDTIKDGGNDGRARPGWPASQFIWGEDGTDTITMTGTSTVEDDVTGGAMDDVITTAGGPQSIGGGPGDDIIDSGDGDDRLRGETGNDTLRSGAGDDYLTGGDGTNTYFGGTGADEIDGGPGEDIVSYLDRNAPVNITIGGVNSSDDGNATDGSLTIVGKRDDLDYQVDHVIGTSFDDTIKIIDSANLEIFRFEGRGGRDTFVGNIDRSFVEGGDGDDTLLGSTVVDTIDGGAGNDLIAGGTGADVERGGAGNDRFDQGTAVDGGDAISGGTDIDVVDWSARPTTAPITFTPGTTADDGAAGEADNVDATTESHRAPGATGTVAPTVTLTPAKTTVTAGDTSNVTVAVSGTAGAPTGSVELTENGQRLATVAVATNGQAVIPTRLLTAGDRTIGARYLGDSRYRAANATSATVTVTKVNTFVAVSPLNSPTKVGAQTKLKVTVLPAVGNLQPSGTVTVFEGTTNLQSFSITDGRGDLTLATALTLGRHDLTVRWNGDWGSEVSTSAVVPVLVTADGAAPAPGLAVTTTPAAPTADAALAVKATLSPAAGATVPAGTVTFAATGTSPVRPAVTLGTADVAGTAATLNLPGSLPGGTYRVTATYTPAPGAVANPGATATAMVTVGRPSTATALVSSLNPAKPEDNVTFTATVTRTTGTGVPTGRVTFLDGTVELGSSPLGTDGKATLTRALLSGTHQVTARYDGSDALAPSTSPVVAQVVSGTTTPLVGTTTAVVRTGTNLVATVTPASGTATGSVRFTVDGTTLATVALSTTAPSTASTPVPALAPGAHQVTASYLGSATHAGSTSGTLAVDVPKVASTTTLTRNGNSVVATVASASGTPTGSVTFTLDGTAGTPVGLVGGAATYTLPALADGQHTLTAAYGGSATHLGSTSAPLAIPVGVPAPSAPGTPVVREASRTTATIAWTAPATGAPTGYQVTVRTGPASTVVRTYATGSTATSSVVTGLTPGKLYRFTVAGTNATGTGPASAASALQVPPFTTLDAFIGRQYTDFTGKAPTTTELDTWRTRISTGTHTPEGLMQAASTNPYTTKVAQVLRTYYAYHRTIPVQATLDTWTSRYRAGTHTLAAISQSMATNAEFVAKYGNLSNTNFAKLIYTNVLQRTPDTTGLNAMVAKLNSGTPRGTLMLQYSEAADFQAKAKGVTEAGLVFRATLGRLPTATERTTWEPKLKAGTTTRTQLLAWVLTTGAYETRVKPVKVATQTTLTRTATTVVATVTPTPTAPPGEVRFALDGVVGAPIAVTGNAATLTLPALADGTHTVSAAYSGTTTHAASSSTVLSWTAATPVAPGTPAVTAASRTTATVSWAAPANGPVSGYQVAVFTGPAATPVTTITTGNATSTVISGLTAGKLYRFTVAGTNAQGTGPASAASGFALPPFATVDAFITRQYTDFLGRAATATDLSTWRTRLTTGTHTPEAFLVAASGDARTGKMVQVLRTYYAYYGTLPTQAALDTWTAQYRAGTATLAGIAQAMGTDAAFVARYGNLSNTQFATLIYTNVLQRMPDATGLNAMVAKLNAGTPRGTLMLEHSEAADFQAKTKGVTELALAFRPMLGRLPTAAERTTWEAGLAAGTTTRAQLMAWILASDAYDLRV